MKNSTVPVGIPRDKHHSQDLINKPYIVMIKYSYTTEMKIYLIMGIQHFVQNKKKGKTGSYNSITSYNFRSQMRCALSVTMIISALLTVELMLSSLTV